METRLPNRVEKRFARLARERRTGFIPYITAGYPSKAHTRQLLQGLADAGADLIELGVPFSDPMADGPTIQRSSQVALSAGTTIDDFFELIADLRNHSEVPIVIFSYLNPIHSRGIESFIQEAVQAGADGILPTDLPLGADPALEERLCESQLDLVRLIAPTTQPERMHRIAATSQGFVYYIARTGVTGARNRLRHELAAEVDAVRALSPLPVAVGFGVSSPEQARALGRVADAVVVGSALVDLLDETGVEDVDGALVFAQSVRRALDENREDGPFDAPGDLPEPTP